ncbi:endoglucanase-like [Cylas formicarius]|uniref:endoglucanase-like n=1 Tax=Cylas formicarius TaxID=197179 RepID=UPI002958944E|nr:endoglucanase-like [Cylas formicarius]
MKRQASLIYLLVLCSFSNGQSSPEIVPVQRGFSGSGVTTRYWDCCKPSCAWQIPQTNVKTPVESCQIDGVNPIDFNDQSGCDDNGVAYMCNDQQAWVINDTLSYGFVAASFSGGSDLSQCCHCVLLSFQGRLLGKHLLAQITNTGSDLYQNHFDIAIPGGGLGIFKRGCMTQWNTTETGWGQEIGGVTSEAECSELPAALQRGCDWRFEFLEGVDNPDVLFQEVECPAELTAITKCVSLS